MPAQNAIVRAADRRGRIIHRYRVGVVSASGAREMRFVRGDNDDKRGWCVCTRGKITGKNTFTCTRVRPIDVYRSVGSV